MCVMFHFYLMHSRHVQLEINCSLQVFLQFQHCNLYAWPILLNKASCHPIGFQVELILTAEDLLRLTGSHKRFISGRLTVQPNLQTRIEDDLDKIEEGELGSCFSACLRCIVSILYVFREFKYQLWGGERYDTLESLQEALNSQLVRWT